MINQILTDLANKVRDIALDPGWNFTQKENAIQAAIAEAAQQIEAREEKAKTCLSYLSEKENWPLDKLVYHTLREISAIAIAELEEK